MTEPSFQFDVNIERFKAHVWQHFTAEQINNFQSTIKMYIEIVALEAMNRRIYLNQSSPNTEIELIWVLRLSEMFSWFLKKSWQVK